MTSVPRSPFRVPRWLTVLGVLIVLGIGARYLYDRAGSRLAFPPPAPPSTLPVVDDTGFVGSEACAGCHASEYAQWARSTHGNAGGPPTPGRVRGPFDGRPLVFRDAVVTPSVSASGAHVFTVAQRGHPPVTFRVDAVVGGGFMAGGGTQASFSRFPDGTLRFLPFDYSQAGHFWFCQLRANRGWARVTPAIALADCDAWPPSRILGSSERFQSCQQCHGSQIEVSFDTVAKRYETGFTTLAINCESCHGPGRRHVELAQSGKLASSPDIGMRSLATLTKDQSLAVCFRCHAVKAALRPGRYALKLPALLDTIYFADGRTRVFAYQEGHLSSDCYINGSMTCVDCHDPHSQRYRDIYGAPLPGRLDDGQCVDCHASKAAPVERHTHHGAASPGSRCVACHMPYLQEPSVGRETPYARSDHTIPIPRPRYDAALGVETACHQCHRDQPVQALDDQVARWYGVLKPQPKVVAAVLAADSVSDATTALRTVLTPADGHATALVSGLARFMGRNASANVPRLDRGTIAQLEALAQRPDVDVQALALATLHALRGNDPGVRRFLVRQLEALGSSDEGVRDRWAWILRARGHASLSRGDYPRAVALYGMAQEVRPDDPAVRRSLGIAYTRMSDFTSAVREFKASLALSPDQPQVLVELGFASMQRGDLDSAIVAYREAITRNPWEPGAYANLGIAYLRDGNVQPGVQALERAVALDPSLAEANFALASVYAQKGDRVRAVAALERGLEFDPANSKARRMLQDLRR